MRIHPSEYIRRAFAPWRHVEACTNTQNIGKDSCGPNNKQSKIPKEEATISSALNAPGNFQFTIFLSERHRSPNNVAATGGGPMTSAIHIYLCVDLGLIFNSIVPLSQYSSNEVISDFALKRA